MKGPDRIDWRDRAAAFISRRATALGWTTAGLALFLFAQIPRLTTISSVDVFLDWTHPSARYFREFKKEFPKEEYFLIAFEDEALFSAPSLHRLRAVTEELAALEEVMDVSSLANVVDTVGDGDAFIAEKFLKEIPDDPAALEALRRRAVAHPLYRRQLVSTDGRVGAIVVYAHNRPEDPLYQARLLEKTEAILSRHPNPGGGYRLAGYLVTNVALDDYMNRDLARFLPLVLALVGAAVLWVFRSGRLLALAMLNIGVTLGATLGFAAMAGYALNTVTTIVVPLCVSLALADTIHVFGRLDAGTLRAHPDPRDALRSALRGVVFSCLLTSVNTALGFASFASNRITAIAEFGVVAASAMVFEFFFTFGLLAPLLLRFKSAAIYRDRDFSDPHALQKCLRACQRAVKARPGTILVIGVAVLAVAAAGVPRVRVDTDFLKFFWPDERIRRDVDFIEQRLCGTQDLSLSVRAPDPGAFKDPAQLAVLERLEAFATTLPTVDVTTSLADYLKDMNQSFHNEDPAKWTLPTTRRMVEQFLLLYSGDDLEDYVTPDYRHARITIHLSEHSLARLGDIARRLDEFARSLPTRLEIRITGYMAQEINTANVIVEDQAKNLLQSVVSIGIVMWVVLRSLRLALLFLMPNLYPIVLNFGLMGYTGVALDTGTALIASAAFGIVVDDTVHFMMDYREHRRSGTPVETAVLSVMRDKGEAVMTSFLVLALGFGVLMLSRFVPIFHFGLLNVFVLSAGVLADVFLLPAWLLFWSRTPARRFFDSPQGTRGSEAA